jgi:ABC-type microcin C transport system permease subunit YejE
MKRKKTKKTSIKDIESKLREKKEMPGVGELLTYGVGSNHNKERTWLDIFSLPIILLILFLLAYVFWVI